MLSCVDVQTGKPHYSKQRIDGLDFLYASIVGAADQLYVTGRNGSVAVIKEGPEFETLAVNTLDEGIDASPVIVGEELYLRGEGHLYCIREMSK